MSHENFQQHGSVYWSAKAIDLLKNIPADKTLEDHLFPNAFSLPNAPIWQDSSTTEECQALEAEIGGPQKLADLTGSRAYERFTGPQISKVCPLDVLVVLWFATSLVDLSQTLGGLRSYSAHIPGILLLSVSVPSELCSNRSIRCQWHEPHEHPHFQVGRSSLERMRRRLIESQTRRRSSSRRHQSRFNRRLVGQEMGFPNRFVSIHLCDRCELNSCADCIIAPFTGDNPGTVVALSTPGDALLSLGTSTTYLLAAPPSATPPKRMTTSHLLSHPTTEGASIVMLCYKNGALARSQILERYASGSWDKFNELVEHTPPGNNSRLGLYFPLIEIIPPNVQGQFLFSSTNHSVEPVDSFPDEAHPRAILESQFLSIKSRVLEILPNDAPPLERLILTGGAAGNPTIRQLVADVFNLKVYMARTKEAGSLGGALLAKYVWWKPQQPQGKNSYTDMRHQDGDSVSEVASPNSAIAAQYEELVDAYRKAEEWVVAKGTKNVA